MNVFSDVTWEGFDKMTINVQEDPVNSHPHGVMHGHDGFKYTGYPAHNLNINFIKDRY